MLSLDTITVTTYDADGFLGIQVDPDGDSEGTEGLSHAHHPFGFFGRPKDPDTSDNGPNYGAVAAHWTDGDEKHAICLEDPRDVDKIPPHSKGSVGVYNSKGSFILLDHDQETATWYVPMDDGARAHCITIGKDGNGKEVIDIAAANGACLTILEDEVTLSNAGGTAFLTLDADGIKISGNVKLVGGLDVGGTGALAMVLGPQFLIWANAVAAALNAVPITGQAISAATTALNAVVQTTGMSMAKSAPGLL
jgi:hypothetical protein